MIKINKFNENSTSPIRYEIDLDLVFKNIDKQKNTAYIKGITHMLKKGKGTVIISHIFDSGNVSVKSDVNSYISHAIPMIAIKNFDIETWKINKEAKKFGL